MAADEVAGTNQQCPQCGGAIMIPLPSATVVSPVPTMPTAPVPQPAIPIAQPAPYAQPVAGYPAAKRSGPSKAGYWIALGSGIFVIAIVSIVALVLFTSGTFSSPTSTVNAIINYQRNGSFQSVYNSLSPYGQRQWMSRLFFTTLRTQQISESKTPNVIRVLKAYLGKSSGSGAILLSRFRSKMRKSQTPAADFAELAKAVKQDLPDSVNELYVLPPDCSIVEMNVQSHGRRAIGTIKFAHPRIKTEITKRIRLSRIDGSWKFDRVY